MEPSVASGLQSDSLDAYCRCPIEGCEWMVRFPVPTNCWKHRGPALAQYLPADDGSFLDYNFMPSEVTEDAWD